MVARESHRQWLHAWAAPLIPFAWLFVASIFYTRVGWPSLEVRVWNVVGVLMMSATLFALSQPWKYRRPD